MMCCVYLSRVELCMTCFSKTFSRCSFSNSELIAILGNKKLDLEICIKWKPGTPQFTVIVSEYLDTPRYFYVIFKYASYGRM
jgi:hypothetical protein